MDFTQDFVLLDLSSYIFYRIYAMQRWMITAKIDDSFTIEQFRSKFTKLFEQFLKQSSKKLKVPLNNVILARDCPRNEIWRMKIYPEYKQNRNKNFQTFDPMIFAYTYNELLPSLVEKHKMQLIGCDNAEGDDIIAIISRRLKTKDITTYILSLDNDLLQLQDDNVRVFDFQLKPLAKAPTLRIMDIYLKWKTILGDDSDNIPSIDKRIGKITAERLARSPELLKEKLSNQTVLQNYKRNDLLINFDHIPEHIVTKVTSLISPEVS
jgi:5'-3' exonuclease